MKSRQLELHLNDDITLENIGDAFSSPIRRRILTLLSTKSHSISELTSILKIAPSTMSFHIKILRDAGLVKLIPSPAKKGNEKNVSLNIEYLTIFLNPIANATNNEYIEEIPIGGFSKYDVTAPCLICDSNSIIDPVDSPVVFASPRRVNAQLVSFMNGYVQYDLLTSKYKYKKVKSISFSMEICSECPNYNNNWKSDISFYLNEKKLGTYRSPGDFGGRKGRYSPDWWPIFSSQYGNLVKITINEDGTYINNIKKSDITISDIDYKSLDFLSFKIAVEKTSPYPGGINIFGKCFGDYEQDIVEIIEFHNN